MATREQLDATVEELRGTGGRSVGIEANVTSAADCERMAAEAIAALGDIDILVANAGGATLARAWEITEEEWDFVNDVCLKGVWLTTKYVVPHMIERTTGKIVVTSSRNGLRAEHGYAHYNAAKAGAIHYAKSLALELGPYGINVNVVCPTQMADRHEQREVSAGLQSYMIRSRVTRTRPTRSSTRPRDATTSSRIAGSPTSPRWPKVRSGSRASGPGS